MSLATPIPTTAPGVIADVFGRTAVRNAILVVGGAAFVGLAAQVSIPLPFTPVPLTGQTFAVLLTAAALGMWRSVASMALYAVAGLVGVPWFADGESGIQEGALVASFGYIVGFILAAALVGRLADQGATRTYLSTVGLMMVGNIVIYAVGVPWLKFALDSTWAEAVEWGMTPFLLGAGVKIAAAAGLFPPAWRAVEKFTSK